MFADIVDIESLNELPQGRKVSICEYVRKVFTFILFFILEFLIKNIKMLNLEFLIKKFLKLPDLQVNTAKQPGESYS